MPENDGVKVLSIRRVPRERDIEWLLREGVHARGGMALKFTSSIRGVPDRIIVMPWGRVVFVELKTRQGRLSYPQEKCIEALRALNAQVAVLRSVDDVMQFLECL